MKKLAFLLLLSLVPVRRVKAGITKGQATAVAAVAVVAVGSAYAYAVVAVGSAYAVVAVGGAYYALHSWASNTKNLFEAVRNGGYWKTRILIAAGANPNATDQFGDTPLHLAAQSGNTETAIALLESGANPNATNKFGDTPLHLAAQSGNTETAIALLESGANHNATNQFGDTPLDDAARGGHTETTIALLESGANPNTTNQFGRTLLHLAAQQGRTRMECLLLVYGAQPRNISSQNPQINTMLRRYRGEQLEWEQKQYGVPGSLKQIAAISQLRRFYKEHNGDLVAVRSAINNLLISSDLKDILLYWLGDSIQA